MRLDEQPVGPLARLSVARFVLVTLVGLATGAVIGCAAFGVDKGQALIPDRVETRTGPFALYTNAKIPADAPAVRSLQALEADLAAHLGVRVATDGPPVEVYILKDRDAFSHFLLFYHPELPPPRLLPRPGPKADRLHVLQRSPRRGLTARGDARCASCHSR